MSPIALIVIITPAALSLLCSCDASDPVRQSASATQASGQPRPGEKTMNMKLRVRIGAKTFAATLDDNPTTARLRQMLPLTLDMPDLNANEKHARLPDRLPTDLFKPGT